MWQWRCFGIANLLKTLHDLYVAALSEGVSFGERLVGPVSCQGKWLMSMFVVVC
jgi:hypothetical protein